MDNSNYGDLCDDNSKLLELFIEAHNLGGSGTNVCADIDSLKFGNSGGSLVDQVNQNWSGSDSNGSLWAMAVKLNGDGWFCIDSLGSALVSPSNIRPITGGDKTC